MIGLEENQPYTICGRLKEANKGVDLSRLKFLPIARDTTLDNRLMVHQQMVTVKATILYLKVK